MASYKELEAAIKALVLQGDGKDAEIELLRNELQDTLKPSTAMDEITHIVALMLEENMKFVAKQGLTPKAKENRERLIRLVNITETFNMLSCTNQSLKLYNRELYGRNVITMAENRILRKQIKDITDAFNDN